MTSAHAGLRLLIIGCALLLASRASHAVTLSSLLQGGSITSGDILLTDWTFNHLETEGGATVLLDQIEVFPLADDPFNPGIGYFAFPGAFSSADDHEGASVAELSYSFNVQTVSGEASIEDNSAEIIAFAFSARPAARIRVIQYVENQSGSDLSQLVAFAKPPDMSETLNLFVSEIFQQPQAFLHVETTLVVSAPLINDFVRLSRFEQRFGREMPVPEPAALFLAGQLLCLCTCAFRPRRG